MVCPGYIDWTTASVYQDFYRDSAAVYLGLMAEAKCMGASEDEGPSTTRIGATQRLMWKFFSETDTHVQVEWLKKTDYHLLNIYIYIYIYICVCVYMYMLNIYLCIYDLHTPCTVGA